MATRRGRGPSARRGLYKSTAGAACAAHHAPPCFGRTVPPPWPSARSFCSSASAPAWVFAPPSRTRKRCRPEELCDTLTSKPCERTCRARCSAFARLAKLPSCTTHAPALAPLSPAAGVDVDVALFDRLLSTLFTRAGVAGVFAAREGDGMLAPADELPRDGGAEAVSEAGSAITLAPEGSGTALSACAPSACAPAPTGAGWRGPLACGAALRVRASSASSMV